MDLSVKNYKSFLSKHRIIKRDKKTKDTVTKYEIINSKETKKYETQIKRE